MLTRINILRIILNAKTVLDILMMFHKVIDKEFIEKIDLNIWTMLDMSMTFLKVVDCVTQRIVNQVLNSSQRGLIRETRILSKNSFLPIRQNLSPLKGDNTVISTN